MAAPPSLAGAVHDRLTWPLPGVPARAVGAPGAVAGAAKLMSKCWNSWPAGAADAGTRTFSQTVQGLPGPQVIVPGPLPTSASVDEPTPTLRSTSAEAFGGAAPRLLKFWVPGDRAVSAQRPPWVGAMSAAFVTSDPNVQIRASMPNTTVVPTASA